MRTRVTGRAPAEAAVGLANAAVQAEAVFLAARPVRVLWAALVAVQARPARQARALPIHRVTAEAVFPVAGAGHLAAEAIKAIRAQALRAAVPGEAVFAQARAVGREAAGAGSTVAGLCAVLSEAAHRALLPAPVPSVAGRAAALSCESVAEPTIVAAALQGAVGSMKALRAGQGADGAHPARGTAAGAWGVLEDTPILARMRRGAEETIGSMTTGQLTAGPSSSWGTEAGSSLGVAGRPVALAAELAGGAVVAWAAGLKAVWGLQARRAEASPTFGVTGAAVAATAGMLTVGAPHSRSTRAGAVVTPPGCHTLALTWCYTASVDTVLGTEWDASAAALIETSTALEALPVVKPHHLAVHGPVDHRGLWTGMGALPGPLAGLGGQQAEGAGLRLLDGGGEAFPDTAGVGVTVVEACGQSKAQDQEQEGVQKQR